MPPKDHPFVKWFAKPDIDARAANGSKVRICDIQVERTPIAGRQHLAPTSHW